MKLPIYLILASLCLVSMPAVSQQPNPACKELDVKVSVAQIAASGNAEIRIAADDTVQPTVYLLSRKDRKIKEKTNSLIIPSVPPGDYLLLIIDEKDQFCPRTIDVTIQIKQE